MAGWCKDKMQVVTSCRQETGSKVPSLQLIGPKQKQEMRMEAGWLLAGAVRLLEWLELQLIGYKIELSRAGTMVGWLLSNGE